MKKFKDYARSFGTVLAVGAAAVGMSWILRSSEPEKPDIYGNMANDIRRSVMRHYDSEVREGFRPFENIPLLNESDLFLGIKLFKSSRFSYTTQSGVKVSVYEDENKIAIEGNSELFFDDKGRLIYIDKGADGSLDEIGRGVIRAIPRQGPINCTRATAEQQENYHRVLFYVSIR